MTLVWPELYFVRHGETDWNAEGRYQGSKDIPLNDIGRGQADLNGRLLARLLQRAGRAPSEFTWHVSPLGRTMETMARIRAAFATSLPEPSTSASSRSRSASTRAGSTPNWPVGEMAMAGERDGDFCISARPRAKATRTSPTGCAALPKRSPVPPSSSPMAESASSAA